MIVSKYLYITDVIYIFITEYVDVVCVYSFCDGNAVLAIAQYSNIF
jgi:hypothetical protein